MANFFDISNWQEQSHYQTGGTRSKSVIERPDTSDLYFFKTSIKKEQKDYKHEFWSEIIASEVGTALGFNMLKYDIAYKQPEIGCLSKLMIDINSQQLVEGIRYLQGYDPAYLPESKESYNRYTFHFICEALKAYNLENHIPELIKTIIFDSLIGNSDRHQENWGFILFADTNNNNIVKKTNTQFSSIMFKWLVQLKNYAANIHKNKDPLSKSIRLVEAILDIYNGKYSPIYDNGSCLGREIEDDKIDQMLHDHKKLQAYIQRGTSEIRWDGPKICHFELINNIKKEYEQIVGNEISRIKEIFREGAIRQIVMDIDLNLPESLIQHKLPQNRKELIINMITLRVEKLLELEK